MAIRLLLSALAFAGAILAAAPVAAQSCSVEQLGAAIDLAGGRLRELTALNQPKIDAKIKALAAKRGWPDAVATEQALAAIADARIGELDKTANELLERIDSLGVVPANTTPECGRIQELEAASLELQAAIRAKAAYVLARLDTVIAEAPRTTEAKPPAPEPKSAEPKAPEPKAAEPKTAAAAIPPPPPTVQPRPRAPEQPWSTKTTVEAQPVPVPPPAPPAAAAVQPPAADPAGSVAGEQTYTREEIVRASSGFFGQISANIAAAVERSFSATGKPTGYILGEEGGGAFLAGLRYGKGTLYLRSGGTAPVYWHGPSLGVDFGAAGSKVMFLVYHLSDVEQLYPAFSSLDGQAYVAGGIGVTVMSNGTVQMAPFRAGVGLRLGASVGYVRFTRRPTWNPF